jgi:hypothetical protein
VAGRTLVTTSILDLMIYLGLRFRLRITRILVAGGMAVMAAGILLIVN